MIKRIMIKRTLTILILLSVLLSAAKWSYASNKGLDLAEKLYLREDYLSAAYECDRLFAEHKKSRLRDDIAYLAGLAYLKLGKPAKAREYFEYILNHSDDSFLLDEAQISLKNLSRKAASIERPDFFSIQVGSFKGRKNAGRLYNKFKRKKYTVRVTTEKDGRVDIYKVKIGKFNSRKKAVAFARKLRKRGYQTAIVPY